MFLLLHFWGETPRLNSALLADSILEGIRGPAHLVFALPVHDGYAVTTVASFSVLGRVAKHRLWGEALPPLHYSCRPENPLKHGWKIHGYPLVMSK